MFQRHILVSLNKTIKFHYFLILLFLIGVAPTSDNEPHRLLVKQYYSSKCNTNAAESLSNTNLNMYKEKTRLFKSDGTVVKIMNDESIEVYILSIFIKLPDKKYFFEK